MSEYTLNLKKEFSFKNFLMLFFITYLPIFTFGIFGPTEIFFANHKAFGVVISDFGGRFLGLGTLIALVITTVMLFLPVIIQKIILSVTWLFSLCGYVQTMFLNKNLDQIGATLDGYIPSTETIVKNFLIWAAIILIGTILIIKFKENWKTLLFLVSFILVATQGVAYTTLFLSAPEDSTEYIVKDYYLSAEEQFTVSSKENVIVFILDTLSNIHLSVAEAEFPHISESLTDFTYYNNTDCNYVGTFPSVAHIFTGNDMNPSLKIDDWLYESWNNETTTRYYDAIHAAGYKVNAYIIEPPILVGNHSLSLLNGKIDNLTKESQDLRVNYDLLDKTLLEMSCYRFMPDFFKPYFDVPNTQYASIVTYPENQIYYSNPEYYSALKKNGLTTNDEENYFIIQHLNGIHELINDRYCIRTENPTLGEAVQGIWVMLEEYIEQLKELGVYDNSTIIITADHGTHDYPQSIFFIKHANEHHDKLQISNAPISLDELAPTISQIITGESEYLGNTIYDFENDELRERTLYIATYDDQYPSVERCDGLPIGSTNVYHLYTYTGDYDNYSEQYYNDIYNTVPIADSYY